MCARDRTHFVGGCSQCLVVHLMPFPDNTSLHSPVVHKVSPDISTSVTSRLVPAQHHEVLDSLQQGHTSGLPRDGYDRSVYDGSVCVVRGKCAREYLFPIFNAHSLTFL